jgi:hypothetical protein
MLKMRPAVTALLLAAASVAVIAQDKPEGPPFIGSLRE